MEPSDIILLLIGAGLSLLGSLAYALISKQLNNIGTFKIYIKTVYSKTGGTTCLQIVPNGTDRMLQIPIWVEFVNTKNNSVIVRNMNVEIYDNDQKVASTTQINRSGNKEVTYYGNNGSYSFVAPPYSTHLYELHFCLNERDTKQLDFNKLKITYYDSKGKKKVLPYKDFEDGWNSSEKIKDQDWCELN